MTTKEAIRRIKEHNEIHSRKERQAILITEALNMAVEALEKQIPKKVKVEKRSKDLSVLVCPICSKPSLVGMSYCRFCGQRLDWSEENA